jgi:hypothetical protein
MPIADRPTAPAPRRRRLPNLSRGLCLAATLGATILGTQLTSSTAEAAVPRVLRPGTRPLAFLLGFGPSAGFHDSYRYGYYGNGGCKNNPYCGYNGWYGGYGAFKVTQEFMGHFSGNASGAALGILMNQEFAGSYFGLNIAPKFTYDIQPKRDLGLYISPHFSLGYHLSHYNYGYYNGYGYGGANYHAANIQTGVAIKLILDDRWLVWAQPLGFDFTMGPSNYYCGVGVVGCGGTYFRARYDVLLGGGVTF